MTGTSPDGEQRASGARAATLGLVAGLRSQLPFALLANAAHRGQFARNTQSPLRYFRSSWAVPVFDLMAAGELVADKLPFVPNRIDPGPLVGREVVGGLVGAAIFKDAGRPVAVGLLLGMTFAAVGSFAGYHTRSFLTRRSGFPDAVWAITEDAIALSLGSWATHRFISE